MAITFDNAKNPIAIASYLIKLAIARYFGPKTIPTMSFGNKLSKITHKKQDVDG